MILGKIFFLSIFIQKVKVTRLNQFRELQILWLFPVRSSDTGTAGTGIEILGSCSARPLLLVVRELLKAGRPSYFFQSAQAIGARSIRGILCKRMDIDLERFFIQPGVLITLLFN